MSLKTMTTEEIRERLKIVHNRREIVERRLSRVNSHVADEGDYTDEILTDVAKLTAEQLMLTTVNRMLHTEMAQRQLTEISNWEHTADEPPIQHVQIESTPEQIRQRYADLAMEAEEETEDTKRT